jgi:transmembrane sensor
MKHTNDILQIVTGNLKGSQRNDLMSQINKDEEAREEYRKIKNAWALASSTKQMSEYEVENLYLDFKKQLDRKQKTYQLINRSILKYAAILIIALSVGVIGFWGYYRNQKPDVFASKIESPVNGKLQLHLSNGTHVDLEKDDSKIALGSDQKITIDNEKVIDLTKSSQADNLQMNELVVPFGKKSQLTLEDGTKVWLNAGSRLEFPTKFKNDKREVSLQGEGYFEVAHNQRVPFFVNAGEISVKVLGTRFDISAYKSDKLIETVLLEGSVAIREQSAFSLFKKESVLKPNQKASYSRNDGSIIVKDEQKVDDAIAWTEGWFKFHRQSIDEVFDKLQRYYNVQFEFNSEFPKEDLISGKLYLKDSIEQVMLTMQVVAKIQFRIDGNKIYVEKKMN